MTTKKSGKMPRLATLCVLALLLLNESSALVVDTNYGQVEGNTVVLDSGFSVESFYSIPYARAPVGDLRFATPQSPEAWTGILQATTIGPACMQAPASIIWYTHPKWDEFSEDCLRLNIYTPTDWTAAPFPVMVWFHGGGYVGGANFQYPGHFLAKFGVVVVTVNYRLGGFGFVATPDGTIRGNMGLWDQAMALRFVRDNIVNFGGDRDSVTIFGQSAGASSSSLHTVSPYSQGLFHRAILESGTEQNVWSLNYPGQEPEYYVYQMAEKTNCTMPTDPEMIACLRSLPADEIRRAQDVTCTPGYFCQGYAPIVDGPGGFIPKLPKELKEALGSATVPVISGICKDDGSLYTTYFVPEAADGGFNSTEFEYHLKTDILDIFAPRLTQEQYDDVFEAIDHEYQSYPYIDDLEGNRQAFNQMLTDGAFGYSWDRSLKTNSEFRSESYAYVQAFRSLNASSLIPEWMGVPHMGELPYVWGYAHLLNNQAVRDDSGIQFDIIGWTPEDITYADYVMELWTNFAKYSNPTPSPVKAPFNDTLTTWEKFSWGDNLKVLYLDTEISTKTVYEQRDYSFWSEYISLLSGHPLRKDGADEKSIRNLARTPVNSQAVREASRRQMADILALHGIDVPLDEDTISALELDW